MRPHSVVTLGLALAALAPPARTQDAPEARMPGGIALTIDGTEIPMSLYLGWLVRFRGEAKAIDFAECFLLEREAERLGVVVPSEVVSAETRARLDLRIQDVFGGDREAWLAELEKEHRTEQGVELEQAIFVRAELSCIAILGKERVVTEETLREAWTRKYGRDGLTIDARVIELELDLPPAPPGATLDVIQAQRQAALERVEATALALRKRIVEGESFAALARKHSTHRTAKTGGGFEEGFRSGEFSAEVLDELEKVPAGEISQPIWGMGSWWIFAVDGVRRTPLESVRADLEHEIAAIPPSSGEANALRTRLLAASRWEALPAMWAEPEDREKTLPADETVMLIDDAPIRRAEYARWLLHFQGELIAPRFVEMWVLSREAAKRGISISMDEVHRRVEIDVQEMIEEAGGSLDAWTELLATTWRTPDSVRRDMYITHPTLYLAEDMMIADREVTEEMIVERWQRDYGNEGRTLDALMIELEVGAPRPKRLATGEERDRVMKLFEEKFAIADKIVERLEGGEDFGALARQFSDDEDSRARGGELPEGIVLSDWPEEVIEILTSLEPGQISGTLEVDASLYIFQLLEYRNTPLESVRSAIVEELRSERPNRFDLATFRNVLVRDVPYTVESGMWSM